MQVHSNYSNTYVYSFSICTFILLNKYINIYSKLI